MFDKAFAGGAGSVTTPFNLVVHVPRDSVAQPEIKQEIFSAFSSLKAQFLQVSSDVPPAEALEHPLMQTWSAEAESYSGHLPPEMHAASDDPGYKRAMQKMDDAYWYKKADTVVTSEAFGITKASDFYASPAGKAQVGKAGKDWAAMTAWVFGPFSKGGKQGTPWNPGGWGASGGSSSSSGTSSSSGSSEASGSSDTSGSSAAGGSGGTNAADDSPPLEVFKNLMPTISNGLAKFADMDIDSLLILIMGQLAQDAEKELRDMMKGMQQKLNIKNAKRDMLRALEAQRDAVRSEAQRQLDLGQQNGTINKDVTVDEYMAYCDINMPEPKFDEQTGQWQVDAATVDLRSPQPGAWRPERTLSQSVTFHNVNEPMLLGQAGMPTQIAPGVLNGSTPPPPPPTDDGPNPPRTEGNQLQLMCDKLQDEIDSMGGQSEIDQTRLQIYMDRRSKAFETLSNLMKKISDTMGTITKNLA